jgi:hypothetical protein
MVKKNTDFLKNGILINVCDNKHKTINQILIPYEKVYFARRIIDNKEAVIPCVMITNTYEILDKGVIYDDKK